MALSRTNLLGQISGTTGNFGTGSFVTNSFTPPDNSLLVVGVALIENNGTTTDPLSAMTISGGSLTYSTAASASVSPTSFPTAAKIYTAPVTTGASMTLTIGASGRSIGVYTVSVVAYTGYNISTPTGATATGTQNGGYGAAPTAYSMTLNATPSSASETFAFIGIDKDTAGVTPGSTYTEIDDLTNTTWGGAESEIRTGSTSTTVDWVDLRSGGGNLFNHVALAVEINASTAVAIGFFSTSIHPGKGPALARFYQTPKSTFINPDPIIGYTSASIHPGRGTSTYARFIKTSQGIIISAVPDQAVSPVRTSSSETFGNQSITLNIAPQGIGTSESFGVPVLSLNVATVGIQFQEVFGSTAVAQSINPTGISSQEILGQPSTTLNILPTGLSTSESFGNSIVSLNITPIGISTLETLGNPTVANVVTISPYGIPSQEVPGNPAVSFTLLPTGIPSTETLGTIQTTLTVSAVGISTQETLGVALISNVSTVSPYGISTQERLGTPGIALNIAPASISSVESFGSPSVTTGAVTIQPYGISSQAAFGNIAISALGPGFVVVTYGIKGQEAFGIPIISKTADVIAVFGTSLVNTDIVDETTKNVDISAFVVR